MFYILISLLISCSIYSMDDNPEEFTVTITGRSRTTTPESQNKTKRALRFFLGNDSPHVSNSLGKLLPKKVAESSMADEDLWSVCDHMNTNIPLSDSQELDKRMREWKSLIAQAVEEVIQEKDEEITDNQLQLQVIQRDIKMAKYKLYGALITLGGTTVASACTLLAIIFAN